MHTPTIVKSVDNMGTWADKIDETSTKTSKGVSSFDPAITVVFTSDDGAVEDKTVLKPVFDAKGVPLCLSIIADTYRGWTGPELKAVQDDDGWEVIYHGYDGSNFTTLTEAQLQTAYDDSMANYASDGLIVKNVTYPQGGNNELVRRFMRRHFNCGLDVQKGVDWVNNPPLSQFNIPRRKIDSQTFSQMKDVVDEAIAAGTGLIVYEMHAVTMDATELGLLIDYIQSNGISIVTLSDAIKQYGNVVDVGDYSGQSHPYANGNHFVTGADGSQRMYGNIGSAIIGSPDGITNASLNTEFPENSETIIGFDTNAGFPSPNGVLRVVRPDSNVTDLDYQEWRPHDVAEIYRRRIQTGAWLSWERIDGYNSQTLQTSAVVSHGFGAFSAGETKTLAVAMSGASATKMMVVTPARYINGGVFFNASYNGAGSVLLSVTSISAQSLGLLDWRIDLFLDK